MCKNKGKHCTNILGIITLVLLSLRTSDVATADVMTLITVLHKLVTFADAMTPMKGLHKLVTLAFISVTYFCFENKFQHISIIYYLSCKSYLFWMATSLLFLKLNDIVL